MNESLFDRESYRTGYHEGAKNTYHSAYADGYNNGYHTAYKEAWAAALNQSPPTACLSTPGATPPQVPPRD